MTKTSKLLLLLTLLPLTCGAQAIKSIATKTDVAEVPMNAEIRFAITLELGRSTNPWCGLSVDYGDGTVERIAIRDKSQLSLNTVHRYRRATVFSVRAEGAFFMEGLLPFPPCEGTVQTLALHVIDPAQAKAAERLKQELEQRELALKEAQGQLERERQAIAEQAKAAAEAASAPRQAEEPAAPGGQAIINPVAAPGLAQDRTPPPQAAAPRPPRAPKPVARKPVVQKPVVEPPAAEKPPVQAPPPDSIEDIRKAFRKKDR